MAVYAIVNESRTDVKIGKSDAPEKRLKTLQTGRAEPLFLLGTIPGGYHEEKSLQRRFAEHRLHGEWFDFAAIETDLRELISEDREIRRDKTYPIWEWCLVTGETEELLWLAHARHGELIVLSWNGRDYRVSGQAWVDFCEWRKMFDR
jgi:hypothetical protein